MAKNRAFLTLYLCLSVLDPLLLKRCSFCIPRIWHIYSKNTKSIKGCGLPSKVLSWVWAPGSHLVVLMLLLSDRVSLFYVCNVTFDPLALLSSQLWDSFFLSFPDILESGMCVYVCIKCISLPKQLPTFLEMLFCFCITRERVLSEPTRKPLLFSRLHRLLLAGSLAPIRRMPFMLFTRTETGQTFRHSQTFGSQCTVAWGF